MHDYELAFHQTHWKQSNANAMEWHENIVWVTKHEPVAWFSAWMTPSLSYTHKTDVLCVLPAIADRDE